MLFRSIERSRDGTGGYAMGRCSVGEYGLVDDVHDLSEGGRWDVALAAVDLV